MTFVFGVCMDLYFMHNLPQEAIEFVLIGLAAAIVTDILLQFLILVVLSARQYCYEIKRQSLPLDTTKLRFMTAQSKNIAKRIFVEYKEPSALL